MEERMTQTISSKLQSLISSLSKCLRIFVAYDINEIRDPSSRVPNTKMILILVMSFCGMLTFYVYTAGLISYLMVQSYDIPINSLDDISENPSFKLLVLEGTFQEDFLKHSLNPNYKRIWNATKKQNGLISSIEEGEMQIMGDEQKVYFGSSPSFELAAESYPCFAVKTRGIYSPNYGAYAFSKDSPYIEVFSHQIDKARENGWYHKGILKQDGIKCEKQTNKYFRPLSYKDANSAFGVFVLGCFLACVYSTIECLYKGYNFIE